MPRLLTLAALLFTTLLLTVSAGAQDDRPTHLWLDVFVDSVFIRALPAFDAAPSASTFEGERLEAIGRNADGTWFQVSRPYRSQSIGWISTQYVAYAFSPTLLPLTDSTTGVTSGVPIVDVGVSAFVLSDLIVRDQPLRTGARVGVLPTGVTVPVIGRNSDASWLKVNYLGLVGWVSAFGVRSVDNFLAAPLESNLPPPVFGVRIIPPEVQLAQLNRFRDYVTYHRDLALQMMAFWDDVMTGEIMPCEPPAFISEYTYSLEDVYELPELHRYAPRTDDAVIALNESIDAYTPCGVVDRVAVSEARADATNARIILDNTLRLLEDLETTITGEDNDTP